MTSYRDDEAADEWDEDDDSDDEPTVPCPSCHREILEDTPRCPYCERYISAEDTAAPPKPFWMVATALVCLGIVIYWVFAAF
jgi:hypothetical protein